MFQANAVQVNAYQIGIGSATIGGVIVEEARSKGGFDPYYYKRRNKRRVDADDVQEFVAEVLASPDMAEEAEAAKIAALQFLAIQNSALEGEKRDALATALREINSFYRQARDEIKRRQSEEDEDDDDLLLLSF